MFSVQRHCLLIALRFIAPVIAPVTSNGIKAYTDVNIIGEKIMARLFVIIPRILPRTRNYICVIVPRRIAGFMTRRSRRMQIVSGNYSD